MIVYVILDNLEHGRLIGIWSSEEAAREWLCEQVKSGSWTPGEAASVSIESWMVA